MYIHWIARIAVSAAIIIASFAVPSNTASAAANKCAEDMTTESGDCATPIEVDALTAEQLQENVLKDQSFLTVMPDVAAGEALDEQQPSNVTTMLIVPPAPVFSSAFVLPEVRDMYIWKEGEGNGRKSYTCGPSATRNMIGAMYKRAYGYYKDFGEATIASWEGTTTSGTAVGNIAAALNNHMKIFGSWRTYRPTDRNDYLSRIIVDTWGYHQSVIANVDTEELSFWHGKVLNHFDFDYGYNSVSSPRLICIAEEWDPIYIYGASSYGNPYGRHAEPLINAYRAENKTSYHKLVI